MDLKNNLFLEAISWGLTKPNGFTYVEFNQKFKLEDSKKEIFDAYFKQAHKNHEAMQGLNNTTADTIFLHLGPLRGFNEATAHYIINYGAQFNYIDYLELQSAKENAREARKYSIIAIWISGFALIAAVLVPYLIAEFVTQDVRIESGLTDKEAGQ